MPYYNGRLHRNSYPEAERRDDKKLSGREIREFREHISLSRVLIEKVEKTKNFKWLWLNV